MLPATSVRSGNVAVLGEATLREIWNDLHKTEYPSFMKKPCSTVGQTGSGKMRAAELKSFTTATLVITLVHLWGRQPSDSHFRKMLDHFLLLVDVIKCVDTQQLTKSSLDHCKGQLSKYIIGLFELYCDASFKPNHHLSLHILSFLHSSGPAPTSAAWSFERFIRGAQKVKTNNRRGQSDVQNNDLRLT